MSHLIQKYALPKTKNKIKITNDNIPDIICSSIKEIRPRPIFKFDNHKNIGYIKLFHFTYSNGDF